MTRTCDECIHRVLGNRTGCEIANRELVAKSDKSEWYMSVVGGGSDVAQKCEHYRPKQCPHCNKREMMPMGEDGIDPRRPVYWCPHCGTLDNGGVFTPYASQDATQAIEDAGDDVHDARAGEAAQAEDRARVSTPVLELMADGFCRSKAEQIVADREL